MSGKRQAAAGASVVVPGNHDGVHLGHQALLRGARALARVQAGKQGGEAGELSVKALTFSPHPAALLAPERAPTPLTTIERRSELLRAAGADDVLVKTFDRAFASLSPTAFLEWLEGLGARGVVVGPDFRFGKDRGGDIAMLEAFARARGMRVKVEPPVLLDGQRVSSSGVRAAIAAGDVARAALWLGHVYDLSGSVERGDQRGRSIGFPTANLRCDPVLLPARGVYAVVARRLPAAPPTGIESAAEGAREAIAGVANIGLRPTFGAGHSVEVHLFDFSGDLYGERLRVGFVARLRDEQRFSGVDALRAQIEVDCEAAREVLGASDRGTWAWI